MSHCPSLRAMPAVVRITMHALPLAALACGLLPAPASAQGWPERPVRVIIPFVAGGSSDSVARLMSERLSAAKNQKFVPENRPGAGGAIAAELVARAQPDGYTLFFAATPQIASVPLLQKVNYDPVKDFAPVSNVGINFFVLGVHRSVPAASVKELVEYSKARPGKLVFGSAGTGTTGHLSSAMFLARAGLDMTHAPYKGGNLALADLLGGQIQMVFGGASDFTPYLKDERIRVLAVSSEGRSPLFPGVPALSEIFPGFRSIGWNGFLAPAATPRVIVEQLSKDIALIVRDPATATRLRGLGLEPIGDSPAEFAEFLRKDAPVWRDAVAAAGLKQE